MPRKKYIEWTIKGESYILNECGHITSEHNFPATIGLGCGHACGAFISIGVSEDCMPAKKKVPICPKCNRALIKALQEEKECTE